MVEKEVAEYDFYEKRAENKELNEKEADKDVSISCFN